MFQKLTPNEELVTADARFFEQDAGMPLLYTDPTICLRAPFQDSVLVCLEFVVRDKKTQHNLRIERLKMTLDEVFSAKLFNSRLYTVLGRKLPLGGGDPVRWTNYIEPYIWMAAEKAMDEGIKLPVNDERLGLWDYKPPHQRKAYTNVLQFAPVA